MSIHYSSPLVETTVQCYYIGYPYIEYKERGSFFLVLGSWVGNFMHAKMLNIALGMSDNVFSMYGVQTLSMRLEKRSKWPKSGIFLLSYPTSDQLLGPYTWEFWPDQTLPIWPAWIKDFFCFLDLCDRVRHKIGTEKKPKKFFLKFSEVKFFDFQTGPARVFWIFGKKKYLFLPEKCDFEAI